MVSAWDVYWVMQLDSISCGLSILSIGGLLVAAALTIANAASRYDTDMFPSLCDREERKASWAVRAKARKRVLAVALTLFVINSFVPSTKTAAAMVVLPAIANNQTLQREAGELYGIAKQALKEAVSDASGEKPKD